MSWDKRDRGRSATQQSNQNNYSRSQWITDNELNRNENILEKTRQQVRKRERQILKILILVSAAIKCGNLLIKSRSGIAFHSKANKRPTLNFAISLLSSPRKSHRSCSWPSWSFSSSPAEWQCPASRQTGTNTTTRCTPWKRWWRWRLPRTTMHWPRWR